MQTPEETLEKRSGSCRDIGLAAGADPAPSRAGGALRVRLSDPAEGRCEIARRAVGHGRTISPILHAWAEVYLPGAGWVGLDPTSGLFAGEGHIPLAATPNPPRPRRSAACTTTAEVEFDPRHEGDAHPETPRVTQPYTEEQWEAIEGSATRSTGVSRAGDVRLTMGGEPTFVSIDDMDGAEWNTAAVGPDQAPLCRDPDPAPARPLRARAACCITARANGIPASSCRAGRSRFYWRTDGEPLWDNDALVANEVPVQPATVADAARFAGNACRAARPARRLRHARLRRPGALPAHRAKAAAQCRSRSTTSSTIRRSAPALVQVFERGLDKPSATCCRSGRGTARSGPALGDGALGLRRGQAVPRCPAIRRWASACR